MIRALEVYKHFYLTVIVRGSVFYMVLYGLFFFYLFVCLIHVFREIFALGTVFVDCLRFYGLSRIRSVLENCPILLRLSQSSLKGDECYE